MLLTRWRNIETGTDVIIHAENIFCVDNLSIDDTCYLVERASNVVLSKNVRNEDRMSFTVTIKNDSKLFETFVVFADSDGLWAMPKSVFLKEYEKSE